MAELIWDGKYDKDGRRVMPARVALPFQTIETVSGSVRSQRHPPDMCGAGRDPDWWNRLIWDDKKYVLSSLLPDFADKVDLIYIDPPFATGQDFSFQADIPDSDTGFVREPSIIEQKAYRDTWGKTLDDYLQWFYETVFLLLDLLAPRGSLWVHLDWRVGYQAKCILDEVFSTDSFRNDIVWSYGGSGRGAKAVSGQCPRNHDVILWYTKSCNHTYNPQFTIKRVHIADAAKAGFRLDEQGRWFKTAPRGDYTDESVAALEQEGRVHRTKSGNIRIKYFLRQEGQFVVEDVLLGDTWSDIADAMHMPDAEKTGYATQKPQALLERIIETSSSPGDLVLDCFAGSGTTAVAAERLNRRWIAADLGRFAIHTTRKRLLSIPDVKPFVVQNLGKYERQAWQGTEFGELAEIAYRRFLLNLYRAQPLSGYFWLHGLRSGHLVHVGSVDAPVSAGDVRQIALEFKRAMGTGEEAPRTNRVDVLGWDFAFELNEVAKQQAALANIDFHFVRIPREVLEKKAVEQGDIAFFELAALSVEVQRHGRSVTLELTDFVIPLDDVPEEVQRAIKHWSQWIDYWAVDWDHRSDTFHHEWQTYRTRKSPELQRSVTHSYDEPGCYTVVVKVIDILGNDTTSRLPVKLEQCS